MPRSNSVKDGMQHLRTGKDKKDWKGKTRDKQTSIRSSDDGGTCWQQVEVTLPPLAKYQGLIAEYH